MPVSTGASSPLKSGNFASLLAGFAATPGHPAKERNDDGLEDDVATVSYEQALRTHARRPAAALGLPFDEPIAEAVTVTAAVPEPPAPPVELPPRKPPATAHAAEWTTETGHIAAYNSSALKANRKAASITVRLTKAERGQVHARAAAAGLTASAYLRSCLFEAEALRAQVKEALEQFRSAGEPANGKKAVQSERHAADAKHPARRWWLRSRWLGAKSA